MAGTDLFMLGENDIIVTGDSVSVRLPRARILDIIINPSDFSTFTETGEWSNDAVTRVKIKARRKMELRALQKNILPMAENRSKLLMENFLKSSGIQEGQCILLEIIPLNSPFHKIHINFSFILCH